MRTILQDDMPVMALRIIHVNPPTPGFYVALKHIVIYWLETRHRGNLVSLKPQLINRFLKEYGVFNGLKEPTKESIYKRVGFFVKALKEKARMCLYEVRDNAPVFQRDCLIAFLRHTDYDFWARAIREVA